MSRFRLKHVASFALNLSFQLVGNVSNCYVAHWPSLITNYDGYVASLSLVDRYRGLSERAS